MTAAESASRAVRADDEAAVLTLLGSLSLESRRRRFFFVAVNLPEAALLTLAASWPEAVGLVALADDDQTVVAHALAIRSNNQHEAEVAFEVADGYHDDGLATLLLIRLAALPKPTASRTSSPMCSPRTTRCSSSFATRSRSARAISPASSTFASPPETGRQPGRGSTPNK